MSEAETILAAIARLDEKINGINVLLQRADRELADVWDAIRDLRQSRDELVGAGRGAQKLWMLLGALPASAVAAIFGLRDLLQ
jgi:hypothetical protein